MKQVQIYHPLWRKDLIVPVKHMRRCDVCSRVMELNHYYFTTEDVLRLSWLCNQIDHARIKNVYAELNRKEGFK